MLSEWLERIVAATDVNSVRPLSLAACGRGLTRGHDQPVVVYCASEERTASPKAAERLDKAGFKKVFDFDAGMRGWKAAGLPVERGK